MAGKCYECNSDVNGECGENFNPRYARESDCGNSYSVGAVSVSVPGNTQQYGYRNSAAGCMKAVVSDCKYMVVFWSQQFADFLICYILDYGRKQYIRSCYIGDNYGSSPDCGGIAQRFGYSQAQSCHVCNSHLCNGSSAIGPVFGLLALISISLFKFVF